MWPGQIPFAASMDNLNDEVEDGKAGERRPPFDSLDPSAFNQSLVANWNSQYPNQLSSSWQQQPFFAQQQQRLLPLTSHDIFDGSVEQQQQQEGQRQQMNQHLLYPENQHQENQVHSQLQDNPFQFPGAQQVQQQFPSVLNNCSMLSDEAHLFESNNQAPESAVLMGQFPTAFGFPNDHLHQSAPMFRGPLSVDNMNTKNNAPSLMTRQIHGEDHHSELDFQGHQLPQQQQQLQLQATMPDWTINMRHPTEMAMIMASNSQNSQLHSSSQRGFPCSTGVGDGIMQPVFAHPATTAVGVPYNQLRQTSSLTQIPFSTNPSRFQNDVLEIDTKTQPSQASATADFSSDFPFSAAQKMSSNCNSLTQTYPANWMTQLQSTFLPLPDAAIGSSSTLLSTAVPVPSLAQAASTNMSKKDVEDEENCWDQRESANQHFSSESSAFSAVRQQQVQNIAQLLPADSDDLPTAINIPALYPSTVGHRSNVEMDDFSEASSPGPGLRLNRDFSDSPTSKEGLDKRPATAEINFNKKSADFSKSTTAPASVAFLESKPAAASAKPKKRSRNKDLPKRPLSAYNLFFKDERAKMLGEQTTTEAAAATISDASQKDKGQTRKSGEGNSGNKKETARRRVGFEEMAQSISKKWKELSDELRAHYQAIAGREKELYKQQKELMLKKDGPVDRKGKKRPKTS